MSKQMVTIEVNGNTTQVDLNSKLSVSRGIKKLMMMNGKFYQMFRVVTWWVDGEVIRFAYQDSRSVHWKRRFDSVNIVAEEVEVEAPATEEVEFELPKYGTFRTQIWTTGPNGYWKIEEVK